MFSNKRKLEETEEDEITLKALKITTQELSKGMGEVMRNVHKDTLNAIYNNKNNISWSTTPTTPVVLVSLRTHFSGCINSHIISNDDNDTNDNNTNNNATAATTPTTAAAATATTSITAAAATPTISTTAAAAAAATRTLTKAAQSLAAQLPQTRF
ncbi:hypothetical protein RCL_jg24867.t1 [Rhizophagus clarus]|uniref:Uncharacterized protein n=1 Tax=Rhizophagus clarus TaxID=94130 RepID=A0A8H3QVL4_9GLOM|nr:hypothetical protein RCL_jg24867.t1 [Rhizophagus clarus]